MRSTCIHITKSFSRNKSYARFKVRIIEENINRRKNGKKNYLYHFALDTLNLEGFCCLEDEALRFELRLVETKRRETGYHCPIDTSLSSWRSCCRTSNKFKTLYDLYRKLVETFHVVSQFKTDIYLLGLPKIQLLWQLAQKSIASHDSWQTYCRLTTNNRDRTRL